MALTNQIAQDSAASEMKAGPTVTGVAVHAPALVHETLSSKYLYFTDQDVQSRMDLLRPDALQFEYTRIMMGFLLFRPRPVHILMVGLGGGSLAKYCYRHLPECHITVVEINPHVIALRQQFAVPEDDARFAIVQDDAAHYVRHCPSKFDVVLADGFDSSGLPQALASRQFYDDCHQSLTPGGVLVANLHRCHALFPVVRDRLQGAFDMELLQVNDPGASNCIVFALRDGVWDFGRSVGMRRPARMLEAPWNEIVPSVAKVFLDFRALARSSGLRQSSADLPCNGAWV